MVPTLHVLLSLGKRAGNGGSHLLLALIICQSLNIQKGLLQEAAAPQASGKHLGSDTGKGTFPGVLH